MLETRRLNDKNKVIVTAALTGAVTTKKNNPNLPTQPKEIAESALACYEARIPFVWVSYGFGDLDESCYARKVQKFSELLEA